MKKFLKVFFLSIWMLPQNILGIFCFMGFWLADRFDKVKRANSKIILQPFNTEGVIVLKSPSQDAGVTLGFFIILGHYKLTQYSKWYQDYRHEYGHYIQSIYLGPLYLFIIGLPSILCNIYCYLKEKQTHTSTTDFYHNFYTEKWADKLGIKAFSGKSPSTSFHEA